MPSMEATLKEHVQAESTGPTEGTGPTESTGLTDGNAPRSVALFDVLIRGLETVKQSRIESGRSTERWCSVGYADEQVWCAFFYWG
jgi:hypothetical protein